VNAASPRALGPFLAFPPALRAAGLAAAPEQTETLLAAVGLLGPRGIGDVRRAAHAVYGPAPDRTAIFNAVFDMVFKSNMRNVKLTIVLGRWSLHYHVPDAPRTVTDAVRGWKDHWPRMVALPHPSPRNNIWIKKNPWFAEELLPKLRARVRRLLRDR